MSKSLHHDEERALAVELRREALESRPDFSQTLHERLCRAVWLGEAPPTIAFARKPAARPAWRRSWRWATAMATAAACLAAVWAVAWQAGVFSPPVAPAETAVVDNPPVPSEPLPVVLAEAPVAPSDFEQVAAMIDDTTLNVSAMVESTIAARQFAYLDHDALLAIESLASHLPFEVPLAQATTQVSEYFREETPEE